MATATTTQDLLTAVLSDKTVLATAMTALATLQAQLGPATSLIGTDQTQSTTDTAAFSADLQANGPTYQANPDGTPTINADGSITFYLWDHGTGYTVITSTPTTRPLVPPTATPGPAPTTA